MPKFPSIAPRLRWTEVRPASRVPRHQAPLRLLPWRWICTSYPVICTAQPRLSRMHHRLPAGFEVTGHAAFPPTARDLRLPLVLVSQNHTTMVWPVAKSPAKRRGCLTLTLSNPTRHHGRDFGENQVAMAQNTPGQCFLTLRRRFNRRCQRGGTERVGRAKHGKIASRMTLTHVNHQTWGILGSADHSMCLSSE